MKKQIRITFILTLCIFHHSFSQMEALKNFSQMETLQIESFKKNSTIYNALKKQDSIFDCIINEVNKQQRIDAFIDKKNNEQVAEFKKRQKDKSIRLKIMGYVLTEQDSVTLKLKPKMDFLAAYREIKSNKIRIDELTDTEKSILSNYYTAKLDNIDKYFKEYLLTLADTEYTSDKVHTFLKGTPPSLGKCEQSDKIQCLKDKIIEKLSPNLKKPNFRKVKTIPFITLKILINEEGKLSVYKIEKLSGHFEYSYEAIDSMLTTFKDVAFTPAQSLGFEDPYYLDITIDFINAQKQ